MDFSWWLTGILVRILAIVQIIALIYFLVSLWRIQGNVTALQKMISDFTAQTYFLICAKKDTKDTCPLFKAEVVKADKGEQQND